MRLLFDSPSDRARPTVGVLFVSGDFEARDLTPMQTLKLLEELHAYARKASAALAEMAGEGRFDVQMIEIDGERFANPLFCSARVETRIRNARRRYSPGNRS